MSYDDKNPSDRGGVTRSQGTVMGVVVDVNDPTQTGRVKVRIVGEQDDMNVSDDDLPWYPVMSQHAQSRGVGMFPAGGNYLPGSRIVMRNIGQQGFVIEGAIPNSQEEQGTMDRSVESKQGTYHKRHGRQRSKEYRGNPQSNRYETANNTMSAMALLNNEEQTNQEENQDRVGEVNKENQTPKRFEERASNRWFSTGMKPESAGSFGPWPGDLNSQPFIKSMPKGELIQNAVAMMEQLKKTAESGKNPLQPNSVGGMGNIIGALMSIASMLSAMKKTKPQNQVQPCPCKETDPDYEECLKLHKDSLCVLQYQEFQAKKLESENTPDNNTPIS